MSELTAPERPAAYITRWEPRAFLHGRGGWHVVHAASGRYAEGPYSQIEVATRAAARLSAIAH